jgi:hypothetical protein
VAHGRDPARIERFPRPEERWKELLVSVPQSRRLSVRRLLVSLAAATLSLASLPGTSAAAKTISGRIAGVVADPDGAPQSAARVVLLDAAGATAASGITGPDGRYSIGVAAGRYNLAVLTATGPVQRIARVRDVDVANDTDLDVVVLPPYATLSGTVRNEAGVPLAGAGLQLGPWRARTDADGHFSVQARPGTYSLSIGWGGASAQVDGFSISHDRVQDLTFAARQLTIEGRSTSGEPLAVAAAHVYSPDGCGSECPAGFEFFPGSGEARGSWRSCCLSATVTVLPGDLIVTATPADPAYEQVTAKPVDAPWTNPLTIVMPDAPPGVQQPAKVTWKGVVRHNGAPVAGAELNVGNTRWGDYDEAETDGQGRFELQITPGPQSLSMYAPIGASTTDEDGGTTPGLYLSAGDFDIPTGRTMDINIPTGDFGVTVLDTDGHPAARIGTYGASFTRSLAIFPGAAATATVQNRELTDAAGHATFLMFPETLPTQVGAGGDGNYGWSEVPAGARSATVRLTYTPEVTLTGTVRDARGPLPLVNSPWVSFGGPADPGDPFNGSFIDPAGGYGLTALAGRQTLQISDLPDHEDGSTGHYVATPTLPEEWTISAEIDLPRSRTLDLVIPDAAPASFRAADTNGETRPVHFQMGSTHTVNLGSGLTGTATAFTKEHDSVGPFQHMMFGPANADGIIIFGDDTPQERVYPLSLRVAPGNHYVLALSSDYEGGATTAANPAKSGYWALSSDGTVYNFGAAPMLGNAEAGAVDLEPTPSGQGYWTLNKNGQVRASGDAVTLGSVDAAGLANGEVPASLSATPTGKGYWVFTSRGRAIAFGDAPFLGDMSGTKLNGPVLGSVATPSGRGYYMVASDGGIFAFGDAAFSGSMGGTRLNAPVQSLVPDADGKGYWLVASDGGIFAFEAPFRGSMGATKLNRPVVGMVRYGDGYLMVGADGGIFNFSSLPFAGSLGDKPPASPVVAVAALP